MSKEKPPSIEYPDALHTLKVMIDADQEMLRRANEEGRAVDSTLLRTNADRLRNIITSIGWPTISKVGIDGALFAWLIVQHSEFDPEFQTSCLRMMKQQPAGEVEAGHIALLEDRILVNAGLPQIYGTQFERRDDGTIAPHPIEDREHVDERRRHLGLETLDEYAQVLMENANRRKKQPH